MRPSIAILGEYNPRVRAARGDQRGHRPLERGARARRRARAGWAPSQKPGITGSDTRALHTCPAPVW